MAQQDLVPPDSHAKLPTTGNENKESGESYKRTVDKIAAMLSELYAAISAPLTLATYTVATLPDPFAGGVIYVSDGAAGSPIMAFSDGTDWLRCDTAAAVSDS